MAGVVTRAHFSEAMYPGVNKWWGVTLKNFDPIWSQIYATEMATLAEEIEVGYAGTGLFQKKNEGQGVVYDDMQQGFVARYNAVVWALGFIVTREMYEDNQYAELGIKKAKNLARSQMQTKEVLGADPFNLAFSATQTYADGKPMISADRPLVKGGTWSNKLATPADLSEAALEQAYKDIKQFRGDDGLRMKVMIQDLIIHPDQTFEAARILKSTDRVGTDFNDTNALRALNIFKNAPIVNDYLSDPKAWFIKTDCPEGLKYKERRAAEFTNDSDFNTQNALFMSTFRGVFGMTDPRSIFGSEGA